MDRSKLVFNFIQIMLFIYIWRALAIYEYNDLYYLKNEATWHIIKPGLLLWGSGAPCQWSAWPSW